MAGAGEVAKQGDARRSCQQAEGVGVSWAHPPARKLLPLYRWIWNQRLIMGQITHHDCKFLKWGRCGNFIFHCV